MVFLHLLRTQECVASRQYLVPRQSHLLLQPLRASLRRVIQVASHQLVPPTPILHFLHSIPRRILLMAEVSWGLSIPYSETLTVLDILQATIPATVLGSSQEASLANFPILDTTQ